MTTPAQHAATLADLIADFDAAAINQAQLATGLAAALAAYDDIGALGDLIRTLIARNDTLVASVQFFQPSGVVALVSDLPTGAANGQYWVVTSGEFAQHGYLRVGTAWVDMGLVRGPTGLTPVLSFSVTAIEPSASPTAAVTGTAEAPLVQLGLPRGRNAINGLSLSIAHRLEPGETLASWVATGAQTFVPSQSRARAQTAATSSTVIALTKNGSAWGSVTFAAGASIGTVTIAQPTVAAGDLIIFAGPASADPTLATIAITLAGASA